MELAYTGAVEIAERRAALAAVLQSRDFSRSPALCRLLRYLCDKTFNGKVHEIKEFSIATEVYGRTDEFAEKRDSVVRVEVSRLRKRLQHYYESEGIHQPHRIVIPPGTYQPEFVCAGEPAAVPVAVEPVLEALAETEEVARPGPSRLGLWTAAGTLSLVLAFVLVAHFRVPQHAPVFVAPPPGETGTPAALATGAPQPVRILAGSSTAHSLDRFGAEWSGDKYFIGGEQNRWELGGKEMAVPNRSIRGAPDQLQFRTFRFGNFSYRIPLPEGKYEMRLYFSEVIYIPSDVGDGVENRRTFDVLMNGRPILQAFDIASNAGAAYTADVQVFEDVSPQNGYLNLAFKPILSGAWLNAIELIPNATGKALPIRVVTRNVNITDHNGDLWGIDRYFAGGRQASDGETATGTPDPDLFKWQRYGSFVYRFPVPRGKYRVKLLFSETFFGPTNRGKGGAGSRIFNVYASGVTLLRNFEILKWVGENQALEKVFHGIAPNAQGRIDLTFEPVVNYALVQGIEVMPE